MRALAPLLGIGAAAFAAAAAAAACEAFDDGGSSDGGVGDGGAGDGAAAPEAGSAPDGGPAPDGGTFCSGRAGVFCDDFEQPGRGLDGGPPPWDFIRLTAGPGITGELGSTAAMPSRHLWIRGSPKPPEAAMLLKAVPASAPKLRVSMRAAFDEILGQNGAVTFARLELRGTGDRVQVSVIREDASRVRLFLQTFVPATPSGIAYGKASLDIRRPYEIELELDRSTPAVRLFVSGAETAAIATAVPNADADLALGYSAYGTDCTGFGLHLDDVLVTK